MKLDCKVIEDLLPLYADQVCSEQTKDIVEEHLQECASCSALIDRSAAVRVPDFVPDQPAADRAIKKGFRKIRMRWLAAALLAIVMIPVLVLTQNQIRGEGMHYTNLHELTVANTFMEKIAAGDFENAYQLLDIEGKKQTWSEKWFDEAALTSMKEDGKAYFCQYGEQLEEAGGIQDYEYVGISLISRHSDGREIYRAIYKIRYLGENSSFYIDVSDRGIDSFGGGSGKWTEDPLSKFSMWSEYLWEEYEGCYFDPERGYVYPDR